MVLPQKFPLLSKVRVKQDSSVPEWQRDWRDIVATVVGVYVDPYRAGKVAYVIDVPGEGPSDDFAEDWLEDADNA